jgi:phosphoenolpyruvate phosphomutase
VIEALAVWNGELVEIPYTEGISSSQLISAVRQVGTTPNVRLSRLRRLIDSKPMVRLLEAHNGLTGLIVENASAEFKGQQVEFDGMWSSSLTDSTSRGKPDTEAVDISSRLQMVNEIFEVTTKPLVFDGDTGGRPEHFAFTVRSLERLGVSAVIIEDKEGLKRNSLFGIDAGQMQAPIEDVCAKISLGRSARVTSDFMVVARIESLILERGVGDAVERAEAYAGAGADAIMIHSKSTDPSDVFEFCSLVAKTLKGVPLVAVPTTYSTVSEERLAEAGVRIVIYANHLLRAAYPQMLRVAETILESGRAQEAEPLLASIPEILRVIPENLR